jgi:hypothetical protein
MQKIMGLSLLTGIALLFASIAVGPVFLYLGGALFGFGIILLVAMLIQMLCGD